jgi:hypothetical protein
VRISRLAAVLLASTLVAAIAVLPAIARGVATGQVSTVARHSWVIDTVIRGDRLNGFTNLTPMTWLTSPGTGDEVSWQLGVSWDGGESDPDVVRVFAYTTSTPFTFLVIDISTVAVLDGGWHYIRITRSAKVTVRVDDSTESRLVALPYGEVESVATHGACLADTRVWLGRYADDHGYFGMG